MAVAEGPLSPRDWFVRVWELDGGRCRVTRRLIPRSERNTRHHAIPKRELRKRGLHRLVWDERNGVLVAPRVHERHESAFERIPYEALPERCKEFARELGPWAEDLLVRLHPKKR